MAAVVTFVSMSEKHCAASAVIAACVIIAFSVLEVDAQSTVDDSSSCESSTLNQAAVNLIREGFRDVKDLLGSYQQQCTLTECSNLKQALVSSLICEYETSLVHFDKA